MKRTGSAGDGARRGAFAVRGHRTSGRRSGFGFELLRDGFARAAVRRCRGWRPTRWRSRANLGYTRRSWRRCREGANLGLGCGNPQAIAALKPGEVVLDLGAGAGFDCFLAARAVGADGSVIGVDMTPEMVGKARDNARRAGYGERRLPPGRDRAPAGGRRDRWT